MNTKSSEISSGLVVVAVINVNGADSCTAVLTKTWSMPAGSYKMVRLSDAEAVILQQVELIKELEDFAKEEMSRTSSRNAKLRAQIDKQSAALKLAKSAMDQIDWDVRNGGYADGFVETWAQMDKAIAAIDALKGE